MGLSTVFKTNTLTLNNAGIWPIIYHSELSLQTTRQQYQYNHFIQIQFILGYEQSKMSMFINKDTQAYTHLHMCVCVCVCVCSKYNLG
jgi:hypothetical protein